MTAPLCVLGDFAWDIWIGPHAELRRGGDVFGDVVLYPGGSAANVAVWARRCGQDTHFVGKIGRDRLGDLATEDLAAEQVRAHLIRTDARPTGAVAVLVDRTGERSMVSGRGADFLLRPDELPLDAIRRAGHLHLTAWSFFDDPPRAAAQAAARIARDAGATLSFDPGSFQMIGEMGVERFLAVTGELGVGILLPNRDEGRILTGCDDPHAIAGRLAALYPGALVVLKLGADGALIREGATATAIPPVAGPRVDSTGAGDAFAGAFLANHLRHRDAPAAARFATGVAAWVIARPGGRPAPDAALRGILDR